MACGYAHSKREKKRHAQKTMDGWIDGWMEKFETINESGDDKHVFWSFIFPSFFINNSASYSEKLYLA
jgi:hypothetical protein